MRSFRYAYGFPGYFDYGIPYSYVPEDVGVVLTDTAPRYSELEEPSREDSSESAAGRRYLGIAREAFRAADYREALRMSRHAAVEMPRSAEVHQFASLALFAVGDYRSAASAAHVALTLGSPWDWPTVRGHYSVAEDYTPHLRALEKYVRENPTAAHAPFLLGYHYLMLGHSEAAEQRLTKAVELNPDDKLAAQLLKTLRGANDDDGQ